MPKRMVEEPSISASQFKGLGSLIFFFGALIAIMTGVFNQAIQNGIPNPLLVSLVILFGSVAGLLNVTAKESNSFILAAVALVIVSEFGSETLKNVLFIGQYLEAVFDSLITFVVPATIIVVLKRIYKLEED